MDIIEDINEEYKSKLTNKIDKKVKKIELRKGSSSLANLSKAQRKVIKKRNARVADTADPFAE